LLLSIAQGAKVSWINWDLCIGPDKHVRTRLLGARVTRPYGIFRLVDLSIPHFLQATYTAYLRRRDRFKLNRGIIDAYIEAKHDRGYLEDRGARLALALEMLDTTVCQAEGVDEHILCDAEFNKLRSRLKNEIRQALAGKPVLEKRRKIYEKLGELNRRSFRSRLMEVMGIVSANFLTGDLRRFVEYRNCLIHEGDFYCNLPHRQKGHLPPLSSAVQEYRFMVNFMDKLFLKIVGYSGKYVDATQLWQTYSDLR